MKKRYDIPLPDTEGLYRAWRESNTLHFAPNPAQHTVRGLGLYVVLLFAILPLGLYVTLLAALYQTEYTVHWGVHALVILLGVLFFLVVVQQALGTTGFRGATLRRQDDDTVVLEFRLRRGRRQAYRLTEPVCFAVQFHHERGESSISLDVADGDGKTTREHFRDVVGLDLHLHGAAVAPPMPLMEEGWCSVVPERINLYHSQFDPDANYAATVDATRPLADAVRACLGVPVEFHLSGGAHYLRMETDGELVQLES